MSVFYVASLLKVDALKLSQRLERLNYVKMIKNGMDLLPRKKTIFISYSRKDKKYLDELMRHFKSMPQTPCEVWSDSSIKPGQIGLDEIEAAMDRAETAILMVSPDFLSSEFVREKEIPKLLKKSKSSLKIIGIYISPCAISLYPQISQFQFVNDFKKPISSLSKHGREEIWLKTISACFDIVS